MAVYSVVPMSVTSCIAALLRPPPPGPVPAAAVDFSAYWTTYVSSVDALPVPSCDAGDHTNLTLVAVNTVAVMFSGGFGNTEQQI